MVITTWSKPGIDNMIAIGEFSGKYSESYAPTIIRGLFDKVEILKTMPELGKIVPEKNDPHLRELTIGRCF